MAELTPKQQVVEIIKGNQKFLILTHKNPDGDALGSMLALQMTLTKLGKEATIVSAEDVPTYLSFLPAIETMTKDFSSKRDFIISIDTSKIQAEKLLYKSKDDHLEVVITPKDGQYDSSMVTFPQGSLNFDVVLVLDCPALERLGTIYEENSDLFYETPVVNIDHHAGNDHFGRINMVDLTATSTSEILVSIIEALTGDSKFFDEHIATSLLTGIITDTNSFQNSNTTPKSLTVAAQLVAQGARQQDIIQYIYKTKPLSTLRLWGRALSNLHDEKEYGFVWSSLYKKDFLETRSAEEESGGLIDELLKTASGVEFALLLTEKNGDVHGSLRSTNRTKDVSAISALFGGGGHAVAAAFQMKGASLMDSSDKILSKIRQYQGGIMKEDTQVVVLPEETGDK